MQQNVVYLRILRIFIQQNIALCISDDYILEGFVQKILFFNNFFDWAFSKDYGHFF